MSYEEMGKNLRLGLTLLAFLVGNEEANVHAASLSGTSYTGKPLTALSASGPTSVTCRADLASSTGYYYLEGWKLHSSFDKQKTTSTWILMIEGNRGRVSDGQGNIGTYIVTKRDPTGVILVEVGENVSIQVISIDPSNSSFIYTSQHAYKSIRNSASTFVGVCE